MNLQYVALFVSIPLLSLTILFSVIRMVIGPSLPDRVVALDLISTVGIGAIALCAIATRESTFLDVASILALVSFLSVVAFAYYLHKKAQTEELKVRSFESLPKS